ncbi:YSIRK-type signal peptide-containing protein [Streptococcus equi]|uniref:YSIRK-type signal peptide-containing protein n=1 Tax=Streptococcus equi TaxID=1336 RepID=UPI0023518438|nr:YSIRK-type signal peptide-containing protein [Streptococcus equi]
MFLRNNKQKFSIRKLSAGAASVLVATSVLGGTTVKANSEVSRTATPRLSRDLKNRLNDIAISRDASSAQKSSKSSKRRLCWGFTGIIERS